MLEAAPLFRNLLPHETAAITARLQRAYYPANTLIMEQGVWHGYLYVISSGHVQILLHDAYTSSSAVSPLIVATLGPGECFGEMSLITGEPPTATVKTTEETVLWSLSQADFLTLVGTCPTLLQNMNSILSQRLHRTNQQLLHQRPATLFLLSHLPHTTAPEHTLALHIADALAYRSRKRVLLLELCDQVSAPALHVAQSHQLCPDLHSCVEDHTRIQSYHAPVDTSGVPLPAIASFSAGTTDIPSITSAHIAALMAITTLYDYIVLAVSPTTPPELVTALLHSPEVPLHNAVTLLSADAMEDFAASPLVPLLNNLPAHTLFVIDADRHPTIGLTDDYTRRVGHPIKRLLSGDNQLLEQCWQQHTTLRQAAPASPLQQGVDFVARSLAGQTIGIAFGGGGARGFAHLGVLAGLQEHAIPLDYIAACSSGIIASGMFLTGRSLQESEEIFMEIQRHIAQWRLPRTSLFSNHGIERMLRRYCGDYRFEDLTTPFAMVAVDLATRSGVVLDRGPLWLAGLASVALPGIFPPVIVGEHILADAGMHDPVPVRLVKQMGADIILASELGGQEPPTLEHATPWFDATHKHSGQAHSPHIVDILLKTYDLAMATIGMHSIREADVVFRPKLHKVSLRQFSEGRKFVVTGRESVEQSLPALKHFLPWLNA